MRGRLAVGLANGEPDTSTLPPAVDERTQRSVEIELLREILAEIRVLRAIAERSETPTPLRRAERERLEQLLPPAAGTMGSEWFLTRELVDRLVLTGVSAKSLGKLLARAEGRPIGGYCVERSGALWRIVAVVL